MDFLSETAGTRLLVVSYHFPPGPGVGALRWGALTRYLADMGWEIRVISAFRPSEETPASIQVRHVPTDRTLDTRYKAWKASPGSGRLAGLVRRRRGADDGAEEQADGFPIPAIFGTLRREVGALLAFPDEARGWIRPAARAIRQEVKDFRPDIIVSSGPPHAAHVSVRLAGVRAEQRRASSTTNRGIRWFMDYRDPWASHQAATAFTARLMLSLEKWCLKEVFSVLTTTPEFRDRFRADFPGVSVHWLSNGVDPQEAEGNRRSRSRTFDVVHVGSLYIGRDPKPVVDGVVRFLGRRPEAREGFRLRFVGPVNAPHDEELARAAEGPLDGVIDRPGRVPRDEALAILSSSALAVVLAQDQGLQVPAKLFESVGLGIPTLAITEEGSATAAAARRVGADVADPADPDSVARALERIWDSEVDRIPLPESIRYDCLARRAATLLTTGSPPGAAPMTPELRESGG